MSSNQTCCCCCCVYMWSWWTQLIVVSTQDRSYQHTARINSCTSSFQEVSQPQLRGRSPPLASKCQCVSCRHGPSGTGSNPKNLRWGHEVWTLWYNIKIYTVYKDVMIITKITWILVFLLLIKLNNQHKWGFLREMWYIKWCVYLQRQIWLLM